MSNARRTNSNDQAESAAAETVVQELRMSDPRTLLVDLNIRTGITLDKGFVASIKDSGVLVPIVAVEAGEDVRVRFGHAAPWLPSRPAGIRCRW